MSDRIGLCKIVSRVGAFESMVTICPASSAVRFKVVEWVADGWGGVWLSVRRWRRSTDLLRSVVMSLLTVLGHNLLRCLCVGREYGVLTGKLCVAIVRPSARMSCMASAAAMSCWRVLLLIVGRVVWVLGSSVWSVKRIALMFRWMSGVCRLVIECIVSFHCVRSGCGMGK